jgi:hypothetical protein
MTKREKEIAAILASADANTPRIAQAFKEAVSEISDSFFDESALETALANSDIDAAVAATGVEELGNLLFGIGLSNSSFVLSDELISVFAIGAKTALTNLPDATQKALNFDLLNERGADFMRRDGAVMISDLTASSRVGVVSVIERAILDGVNPKKQIKEIRQLIGLTANQTQAVSNFRRQLETQQVLGLTPPNERRLSATEQSVVARHMREGHLSSAQIDTMVERYFQSMLNKRAEDISRTEALNSINNGQLEMWKQARDAGFLSDEDDRMFWITAHDEKVRATHSAIPGMNPWGVKIGSLFLTPFGLVTGPGDRNINLINCRCVLVIGQVGEQII